MGSNVRCETIARVRFSAVGAEKLSEINLHHWESAQKAQIPNQRVRPTNYDTLLTCQPSKLQAYFSWL